MIRRTLRKLIAALGLGAIVQATVLVTGIGRVIYERRRWSTNPFVVGWMVQLAVLFVALVEAGRRSEREEVREAIELLRH